MIGLSTPQSEILIIPLNFSNLILKNCLNKHITLRKILPRPGIKPGFLAFRASVLSL